MDVGALVEGVTDSEFVHERFRAWCYQNPGLAAQFAFYPADVQRALFDSIYRKGCSDMLRMTSAASPQFMALKRYVDFVLNDEQQVPATDSSGG